MDETEDARDGVAIDSIVAAAAGGDREATSAVLAYVHPLVVRYCRSRLAAGHRSLNNADDVAQEVCMAVVTALPTYQRDTRPFLAFVYGIAAHKVIDAHRSAGRSRTVAVAELPEGPSNESGPEQLAVGGSVASTMSALLSTLPPVQQEILRLRVIVGLSAEETADALGMTAVAVRVSQHRGLGKLRGMLEGNDELRQQVL